MQKHQENIEYLLRLQPTVFQEKVQVLELDWIPLILPYWNDRLLYRFVYRVLTYKTLPTQHLLSILQHFNTNALFTLIQPQLESETKEIMKRIARGKSRISKQDVEFLNVVYGRVDFDCLVVREVYPNAPRDVKLEILELFYRYFQDHEFHSSLIEKGGIEFLKDQSMILDFVVLFGTLNWPVDVCDMMKELQDGNVRVQVSRDVQDFVARVKSKIGSPPEIQNPQVQTVQDGPDIMNILAIHDVFPDLGYGFIQQCLNEFKDTEVVIMKLLENDLPESLASLDKSMALSDDTLAGSVTTQFHSMTLDTPRDSSAPLLPPRPEAIISSRKNIFDGDQFDIFSNPIDMNLVHQGKKKFSDDENDRLEFLKLHKGSILKAAEEDDEYDDTYDSVQDSSEIETSAEERYLVELYHSSPGLFHPSSRKTIERKQIRDRLGWTDEQVEGWFVMLNRDPLKEKRLEKYEWKGNKNEIEDRENEEQEAEVEPVVASPTPNVWRGSPKRGRGKGRGRARGRFHRPQ